MRLEAERKRMMVMEKKRKKRAAARPSGRRGRIGSASDVSRPCALGSRTDGKPQSRRGRSGARADKLSLEAQQESWLVLERARRDAERERWEAVELEQRIRQQRRPIPSRPLRRWPQRHLAGSRIRPPHSVRFRNG